MSLGFRMLFLSFIRELHSLLLAKEDIPLKSRGLSIILLEGICGNEEVVGLPGFPSNGGFRVSG